jgi:hypothetical protein
MEHQCKKLAVATLQLGSAASRNEPAENPQQLLVALPDVLAETSNSLVIRKDCAPTCAPVAPAEPGTPDKAKRRVLHAHCQRHY